MVPRRGGWKHVLDLGLEIVAFAIERDDPGHR